MVTFFETRRVSYSVLARVLTDPGTARIIHFSLFTLTVNFFGTRPVSFSVLARILPDHGTCPDSTIIHTDDNLFRDSPGQFVDTRTDST